MSVIIENKTFIKVYDKIIIKLDQKIKNYSIKKKYGSKINHNEVKILNMIIKYLDTIKNSEYTYYYIQSLTEISNYLNTI